MIRKQQGKPVGSVGIDRRPPVLLVAVGWPVVAVGWPVVAVGWLLVGCWVLQGSLQVTAKQ